MDPIFKKGDYIINHCSGDIAIVSKVDKKNYYHFEAYYSEMFHELKDLKNMPYTLQVNYQKFFEPCTEEEKSFINSLLASVENDTP